MARTLETEHGDAGKETSDGVLQTLGLDGQIFVGQLVNFLLVIVIVWFLILKPLTKKLDERRRMIDESIEKARKVDAAFEMSQQKYQEKIDEAKSGANKIIEKSHQEATRIGDTLKMKAKEEIELLVAQAKRNIEIDREEMRQDLRKETADLVVLAVKKIISERLDKKGDIAYIQEILSDLKS